MNRSNSRPPFAAMVDVFNNKDIYLAYLKQSYASRKDQIEIKYSVDNFWRDWQTQPTKKDRT